MYKYTNFYDRVGSYPPPLFLIVYSRARPLTLYLTFINIVRANIVWLARAKTLHNFH